jgi:hypothetical protein
MLPEAGSSLDKLAIRALIIHHRISKTPKKTKREHKTTHLHMSN